MPPVNLPGEIQKRREESLKRKQQQMERIRKGSKKPIKKAGLPVGLIVAGTVILAAILAIAYYFFFIYK